MSVRRSGATATLLPTGDVLVAGGGTAAAELYDPSTGRWSPTAAMSTARTNATATLLQDGDVLVAGGCCEVGNPNVSLTSAELYDPSTATWSPTGSMNVARAEDTATLLQNGDVLVAGGECNGTNYGCDSGSFLVNLKSAELYDPASGTWTLTGSMKAGRDLQTATLLQNGEVLVAGGFNSCDDDFCSDLSDAELYDPVTGTWLHAPSMSVPREQQTATMLPDGDVLVAGGLSQNGDGFEHALSSAELYDPIARRWFPTGSMNHPRVGQSATLLQEGWVLVTGGGTATSEVYEPELGLWTPVGDLSTARTDQTATLLGDGDVLVAGGTGSDDEPLASAEVYDPGTGPLVSLSATSLILPTQEVGTTGNALAVTVTNHGTAPLDVSGAETTGTDPSDFLTASECSKPVAAGASCTVLVRFSPLYPGPRTGEIALFDNAPLSPQAVKVSGTAAGPYVWAPTGSMTTARGEASATELANGEVLIAGGEDYYQNTLVTAELYDPVTGSFSPTGAMGTSREDQAATILPDGSVLVAGGLTANEAGYSALASAEIYDPATGSWSATTPMLAASAGLTATLLGNGLVLVTGYGASNPELYDPATATWTQTGPLPVAGEGGLAALLHDGDVLVTGGADGASALYNPTTGAWSATGSLPSAHYDATATVLQNGEVLVAGGQPGNGGYPLTTAALYNPSTGSWSATGSLPEGRFGQSAVLLTNGQVLVAGGCDFSCQNSATDDAAYVFADGYWTTIGSLPVSTIDQSAIVLKDGDVLLAGGYENDSGNATTAAELYISPLVTASPENAAPGQTVTISGNGFYAHEVVTVSFGAGMKVLATPTADAKGQFSVAVTVPTVRRGNYQLSAQGQTSFAYATSTLRVT